MTGELHGTRLVVVGASAGIGRAIALRAATAGAQLALVSRRREPLEELAKEVGGACVITADLSVHDDCARIARENQVPLREVYSVAERAYQASR
jgi:short-subunit dehydrogenase